MIETIRAESAEVAVDVLGRRPLQSICLNGSLSDHFSYRPLMAIIITITVKLDHGISTKRLDSLMTFSDQIILVPGMSSFGSKKLIPIFIKNR